MTARRASRVPVRRRDAQHAREPLPPAPAPPPWRDPWLGLALLAPVALVLHSLGAPLGEPFADDFDYLYRALLDRRGGWFDGFGSTLYWRPLGRQLYFGLLARTILAHPFVVPLIHVLALAATTWLVYRALRPHASGAVAAFAASFPCLAESTRMLIAWPSHFMDVGAILFAAIALHEAARRRMPTALVAMVASLLGKEVGVLAALALPWAPGPPVTRAWRVRWTIVTTGVVGAWGAAYLVASRVHGMTVPPPEGGGGPVESMGHVAWAIGHSLAAQLAGDVAGAAGRALLVAATIVIAAGAMLASRRQGPRALARGEWVGFGAAWFLLAAAPLATVYPAWAPYRSAFGALGLGIALAALLEAARPQVLAALAAVRLVAFVASPGPATTVAIRPEERGAAFDFGRLTRLERLTRAMRETLARGVPRLAPHATVVLENLPVLGEYAFSGDRALRVWYRDSTLHLTRLQRLGEAGLANAATVVEYTPSAREPLALVPPAAMAALLRAMDAAGKNAWPAMDAELERADALAPAPVAPGFDSKRLSLRAGHLLRIGQADSAATLAQRAIAIAPYNVEARWIVVQGLLARRLYTLAAGQLDTLVSLEPSDPRARQLLERLRAVAPPGPAQ